MAEKSSEQVTVLKGSHLIPVSRKKSWGRKGADKRSDHFKLAMNR